jgi:serine protease DegQ
MRKLWLIFAQSVTICLALLFALKTFYPSLLEPNAKPVVIKQVTPDTSAITSQTSYSNAAQKAMPTVVNIFTSSKKTVVDPHQQFKNDPFYKHFFGDENEEADTQSDSSLGSGVIVSESGLILTNNHVIITADEIEVALADGRKLSATIVGTDPETDLALLKIEAENLPSITFANADQLKVGDIALAIGNPFGVGQTVTQGIISALGRNHLGINTYENFIQTDASINPGNSGGALIDIDGNLIGINSAIYSRSGGSMGIGFAIPVSIVKHVMEQITTTGSVTRGWIGIEAQDITAELSESFNLKNTNGSLIAGVLRDSPADIGGLRAGDILTQINHQKITDSESMLNIIAALKPQDKAELGIIRHGEQLTIEIIVGKRPIPPTAKR